MELGRPRVGVLVPAHDEEAVIRSTLESIRCQLAEGDRLLVIADNCTDSTARIAADCGAEVIERSDALRRGKGYALQSGLDRFADDRPAVVVVIDADCQLMPGCLSMLARQVAATSRPAQACYLMTPPPVPRAVDVISSLAILVKNRVRPLGMSRMGLPCLITGSGSAFPWQALQVRSFSGGNIVEDMQFAVDLALAGFAPRYCDEAVVLAGLPDRHSAFLSQRRRWEHGHLQTLFSAGSSTLGGVSANGRRIDLVAMAADLSVPPLSLLTAINVFSLAADVGLGTLARESVALRRRCLRCARAFRLGRCRVVGICSRPSAVPDAVGDSGLCVCETAFVCDVSVSPRTRLGANDSDLKRRLPSQCRHRTPGFRTPWTRSNAPSRHSRRCR